MIILKHTQSVMKQFCCAQAEDSGLHGVFVDGETSSLVATDKTVLVSIDVEMVSPFCEADVILPIEAFPSRPGFWRYVSQNKDGKLEVKEVKSGQPLHADCGVTIMDPIIRANRLSRFKFNWRSTIPVDGMYGVKVGLDLGTIGLNPKLVGKFGALMKKGDVGFRFTFYGSRSAVVVNGDNFIGLIMPVRLWEDK
jgi:hypothetical protein